MALTTTAPYRQAHYIGEYANDTAVNAAITSVGWTLSDGMMFFDTTLNAMKFYNGSAWAQLGTSTADTWAAVLVSGASSGGTDPVISSGDTLSCIGDVDLESAPGSTLTVKSSATISVASGGTLSGVSGATMNWAGTVNFQSGADVNVQSGGGVDVQSGGDVTFESGGTLVINDITNTTFTGTPTSATHAVNKGYVDGLLTGISWKEPVVVRAPSNVTLSAPGATIDGVAMSAGDRFLAVEQSTGTEDGIYEWNGAAVAATRSADAAAGSSFANAAVFVEQGNSADTAWVCTNDSGSDVIGTDALTMVKFAGGNLYSGGNGIDITGTTISVDLATNSGLEFDGGSPNKLRIDVVSTDRLTLGASGLDVSGLPSLFKINAVAVSANVTAAALNALTLASNDVGATYHDHDSIYYTETELGSTTGGSEGASLIGTDTKANLNSATDVETALTWLNGQNPPKRSTNAGTPIGAVTGIAGDICVDTTNSIVYMHYGASSNNTSWTVAG